MSQHYFTTTHQGRPITVMLGWDRPLSHFFLVVEYNDSQADSQDDETEQDEGILYSNLNDPNAWGKPLAYYRDKLTELGIAVPESMFTESLRDEALNVGNRYVWHEADGFYRVCRDDEAYFHVDKCNFCGAPATRQGRYHSGEPVGLCDSQKCLEAFGADSADEWEAMAKAGRVYSVNVP